MKRIGGGGRKILLIACGALVCLLVLLFGFTSTGLVDIPVINDVISTVFVPVQNVVTGAVNSVSQAAQQRRTQMELMEQLDQLTQENKILNASVAQMEELRLENERLRNLLSAKQSMPEYDFIAASVTGKEPGGWFQSFTLNVGSLDGVSEKDIVVNNDGLIGMVTQVDTTSCVVMGIVDSRSAVSGLIERTRDNGVVKGSLYLTDNNDEFMQMHYLPEGNGVLSGDRVITSGLDSIYPKGLYIGQVRSVSRDNRYVVVDTAADFAHVEDVLVMRMHREEGA